MKLLLSAARQANWDSPSAVRDPKDCARSLDVQTIGRMTFRGISREMFGYEDRLMSLGENVYITDGVQFITHDGGTLIFRKEVPDLEWTAPIYVRNEVNFGVSALILPGVTIANRCVIPAASVVAKDVPDNGVVGGVPARRISSVDEYMDKMKGKSLGLGHLSGAEKAAQLKKYFGIEQG